MAFFAKVFKPNISDLVERGDICGLVNVLKSERIKYADVNRILEALAQFKQPQSVLVLREIAMVNTPSPPVVNGQILKGVMTSITYGYGKELSKKAIQLLGQVGGDDAGKALMEILNEQKFKFGFNITYTVKDVLDAIKESRSKTAVSEAIDFLTEKLGESYDANYIISCLEELGWKPETPQDMAYIILTKARNEDDLTKAALDATSEVRESLVILMTGRYFRPSVKTLVAIRSTSAIQALKRYIIGPVTNHKDTWNLAVTLSQIGDPSLFLPLIHYIEEEVYYIEDYSCSDEQILTDFINSIAKMAGKNEFLPLVNLYTRSFIRTPKHLLNAIKMVLTEKKSQVLPLLVGRIEKWDSDSAKYARCIVDLGWQSELSPKTIVNVAKKIDSDEIGITLTGTLNEQSALGDIATKGNSTNIRGAALKKLTDLKLLLKAFEHNIEDKALFDVLCTIMVRLKAQSISAHHEMELIYQMQSVIENRINSMIASLGSTESQGETYIPDGGSGSSTFYNYYQRGYFIVEELTNMVRASVSFLNDKLLQNLAELNFQFKGRSDIVDKWMATETVHYTADCKEINSLCRSELTRRNKSTEAV